MKKWMYDSVLEAPTNCQEIFDHNKELTEGLVKAYCKKDYSGIVIAASGSSYNIACCAKYAMEEILDTSIEVIYAVTYAEYAYKHHKNKFVICTSQGGRSTNTLAAYNRAKECGNDVAAVISESGTPMQKICKDTFLFGNEKAGKDVFVCRGLPTSVLFFDLFAINAAFNKKKITEEQKNEYLAELKKVIDKMNDVRELSDAYYEAHKQEFYKMERIMVTGIGSGQGVAQEGALKLEETAGFPSNWYEMEEFLHGPVYEIKKNHSIFIVDMDEKHHDRAVEISEALHQLTDHVYVISKFNMNSADAMQIDLDVNSMFLPILFVIPFQVFASRICDDTRASGITIYTYRFMQQMATKAK